MLKFLSLVFNIHYSKTSLLGPNQMFDKPTMESVNQTSDEQKVSARFQQSKLSANFQNYNLQTLTLLQKSDMYF